MENAVATYSAADTFANMFDAFTTGFNSVMGFITANSWILIIVAMPVILGILGVVISFIKSRM